ncbi:MAG: hypothetical protein WAV89_08190 [Ignavibacteriaceae bacterium]
MSNNKKNYKDVNNDYDDFTIIEVWKRAKPYKHFELYKLDRLGSLMFFDDYGIKSENGWVICPTKSSVTDRKIEIENLEPLHWKNKD